VIDASSTGLRGLSLGGDRFFCRDGLLEVWLAMLVDRMSRGTTPAWQRGLLDEWRSQATVRFDGVMTAELDPYFSDGAADGGSPSSAERRAELTRICREVRAEIERGALTPGPLTRRVLGYGYLGEDERPSLLRIADSMLWLLEGGGRSPSVEVCAEKTSENKDLWSSGKVR